MAALALLALLTGRQLARALGGPLDILVCFDLVVPTIHVYLIREIAFHHRFGYQAAAVLSLAALLRPENRVLPELACYPLLALLALLLLRGLHPSGDRLPSRID